MYQFAPLIILFPLIGFLINGLLGRKIKNEMIVGSIGTLAVAASFFIALAIFFEMISLPAEERSKVVTVFQWISAGTFSVNVAFQIDQLSILMTLIVTGVGSLIHLYSIGYMHGDIGFWRFFTYMNLFIFAMLSLVLADNYLLMFLGWEGVGLCSYLLIGFWYDRNFEKGTTGDAAKKAFIVNRIGDFGFLLAMFLIFNTFGSLTYESVFAQAKGFSVGDNVMFWITLLMFVGATGKSAQIPLYVWLPDAMAGPTPVSALIHAATMVTAGIYMVARSSILFALSPTTMEIVAVIGLATAFFAGTIGLVQNDIKKVLAYSTVSQLGYMFLACGVGAFAAGLFHVMTHAFFKALLFLGSGAVIHAMHDEQDIQKMGGLQKYMPWTFRTFLIGSFAISGFPLLSGFFSKDEILWKAFADGAPWMWVIATLAAGVTAFYMFRLVSLTFLGKERFDHHHIHPHEAPKTMLIPLLVLALLSIIGGYVGIPHVLGGHNYFEEFLEPIFAGANSKMMLPLHDSAALELGLMAGSVAIGLLGMFAGWKIYTQRTEIAERTAKKYSGLHKLLWNKYFVDETYDALIVNPIKQTSDKFLWKIFDVKVIDNTLNYSAKFVEATASIFRRIQTGVVQSYAVVFVAGILVMLGYLMVR
ncbi:MAG TPA: NADH-quinone oxidoreductase subunit L [Bacteroidetes bacterium]|nr:NADH-quinone oxidoreductase subunit L [Bacteroidota bacterium]